MWRYLLIAFIWVVFYIVIPGLGAFHVRKRWRTFRKHITDSTFLPRITYNRLVRAEEGYLGAYRFFGNLEAIQGDDIVWIRSGSVSLSADLAGVHVYLLPGFSHSQNEGIVERNEETLPDEMPQQLPWSQVFSLSEGTSVYMSGPLFLHHGQAVFRSTEECELTVVIYDGDAGSILRRSIWGGRQRNEYWNSFTPASLIAGTLALLFIAYNFLRITGAAVPATLALGLSTTPVLAFLPPGIPIFLLYRFFWKKGRLRRAERDILRLPMRYLENPTVEAEQTAQLPDGGRYTVRVFRSKEAALASMREKKIRTTALLKAEDEAERQYFVFDAGGSDPMAEELLIPGHPFEIASLCVRKARLYEWISLGAFGLCYVINLLFALTLFGLLIVR